MARRYVFTPARRAALARAQKRSAELRRKGAGKHGSASFYGKGKKGRRAAKHSTYGKKRDGLSIAQQQRRRQRSNRRKKYASAAISGGLIAVKAAHIYKTNPEINRSVNVAAKRAKQQARNARAAYGAARRKKG